MYGDSQAHMLPTVVLSQHNHSVVLSLMNVYISTIGVSVDWMADVGRQQTKTECTCTALLAYSKAFGLN